MTLEPKVETVEIGPEEAAELLKGNDKNRRLDWNVVGDYARQMTKGQWTFVGDPIRVSVTGRLLDGQNRLTAIIRSNTTQTFLLISNLPDESQAFMDVGKKRTPGDVFQLNGVTSATIAAAIVAMVIRYDAGKAVASGFRVGPGELLEFYSDNSHTVDTATRVARTMKETLPVSPAVCGAVYVLASRVADAFQLNEFFEHLASGLNLTEGSPIAAFRNWVIRRKRDDLRVNRIEVMYALMRTWNAWAKNESLAKLQLPPGGVQNSSQLHALVTPKPRPMTQPTEDAPAVTPYSRTRKEMAARK